MPHKPPVQDSVLRDLADRVRADRNLTPGAQRRLLDKIDECDQLLTEKGQEQQQQLAGAGTANGKGKGR